MFVIQLHECRWSVAVYFSVHVQVGDALRCPATKFITDTLSNMTFLILLTAGTFRLGDQIHPITSTEDLMMNRFDTLRYDEQVDRYTYTHLPADRQTDR